MNTAHAIRNFGVLKSPYNRWSQVRSLHGSRCETCEQTFPGMTEQQLLHSVTPGNSEELKASASSSVGIAAIERAPLS
jgi:hypothetical protein